LQHADDHTRFVADRQAQKLPRAETQLAVDFRLEPRIGVHIVETDGLSFARDPAGDAALEREADDHLVEAQPDERPYLAALAVHKEDRAALCAGLTRGDLQDDMNQFTKVQRGIQALGGFHDAGELFHRAAALRKRQNDGRKACQQIQLGTNRLFQRLSAARLQNAYAKIVATQGAGPHARVVFRIEHRAG